MTQENKSVQEHKTSATSHSLTKRKFSDDHEASQSATTHEVSAPHKNLNNEQTQEPQYIQSAGIPVACPKHAKGFTIQSTVTFIF